MDEYDEYIEDDNSSIDSIPLTEPEIHFLDQYNETILDIYYDFKNRFSFSPLFFSYLKPSDLTRFVTDTLFDNYPSMKHNNYITNYSDEYRNELSISYNIITPFFQQFQYQLDYNTWVNFCYLYSDLVEFQRV